MAHNKLCCSHVLLARHDLAGEEALHVWPRRAALRPFSLAIQLHLLKHRRTSDAVAGNAALAA